MKKKKPYIKTLLILLLSSSMLFYSCDEIAKRIGKKLFTPKEEEFKYVLSEKGDTISELRYKNGILYSESKTLNKTNKTAIFEEKRYNSDKQIIRHDTLYVDYVKKRGYHIGWSWIDLNEIKEYANQNLKESQENFIIGDSSTINQQIKYKEYNILFEESIFYKIYKLDNLYRLQVFPPIIANMDITDVYLCLSDKIEKDFSNVNSLDKFDTIDPMPEDGVYWNFPKEKKELRGFISIIRKDSIGKYYEKKLYLDKKLE